MQAQYFWIGHDPTDITDQRHWLNRRGNSAATAEERLDERLGDSDKCHVIAGDLIPVNPG